MALASVNIFGGFAVTARMLAMYKKRERKDALRRRHAQPAWVLLAYLIAGVCFILALRGLSSPESSRRGNRIGMIGMAIAVVTTLDRHSRTRFAYVPGHRASIFWSTRRLARRDHRLRS